MPKTQSQSTKKSKKPLRRANGEGTLEIRPDGKRRYVGMLNGLKVYGSLATTSEAALESYRKKLQDLKNPVVVTEEQSNSDVPTVEEYMWSVLDGAWRRRLKEKTLAPSTWQMAEQVLRLNIRGSALGAMSLDQVVPSDLSAWMGALMTQPRKTKTKDIPSREIGNTSKRRYLGMLDQLYEHARKQDKLVASNPVRDVPKPEEDEVDFWALNAEEVEELLELCDKEDANADVIEWERRRRAHSNLRRRKMCALLLHGFGPAEACGVKHSDFDGDGILPKAQRQRLRSLGVVERDRLKTKARKGWVAADDELKALMSEKSDGYVLSGMEGQPLEPGNLRRTFAGMVKGTKFEKLTPYDLRHTFAMRLLEEGVDVKTAAELMRHSVEVFLRRYVKSDKARKMAAIKRLQEARSRLRLGAAFKPSL